MCCLRLTGIILTIFIGLTLWPDTAWAAEPVSLDEYWRRVDALADLLDSTRPDKASVRAAAGELAAVEEVLLPDGQILPVDNGYWVAVLRRDELEQENLAFARARLAALRRVRDVVSRRTALATDQTFARLEQILSRSEFAGKDAPAQQASLLQRLLDWIAEQIARLFSRTQTVPGMEGLLTLLAVVVILAVLFYSFRGTLRQWVAEGRKRDDRASGDEAHLSSAEALERAHVVATSGDYRRALRYLYLSTLLWLDERRLLRYDPALTNREFLDQVAAGVQQAGLHEALSPVVESFDRVWYGFAPLDGRGYAIYLRQVEHVRHVGGAG